METGRFTFLIIGLVMASLLTGPAGAASPPAIGWQNVLGGSADDIALSIRQTADGGYVLVGMTLSGSSGSYGALNQDVLVMKLDTMGNLLWQKAYGGYSDDGGLSIEQTTDGGFILVGYTTVDKYYRGGYVPSTTITPYSNGNDASDVVYPAYNNPYIDYSQGPGRYTIRAVNQYVTSDASNRYTQDTGVIRDRDLLVIKLDPAGNLQWQKVMGGNAEDTGSGIQQTTDGGYILVGSTASSGSGDVGTNHGRFDVWVVKLDTGGNLQWQKLLGGYMEDTGSGIQQTDDGGYVLVGTTASENSGDAGVNHGSQDVWAVKLDTGGNIEWQKTLGGGDSDIGSGIRQTASGEYILTGFTLSSNSGDVGLNNGRFDVWVVKLDFAGDLLWQKVLGGSAYDYGTSIWPAADGGYVLTGYTSSSKSGDVGENHGLNDIWAVKLSSAGDLLWQKLLGGYASDRGYGIQQTDDGGYVLTGGTESSDSGDVGRNHGALDVWAVRLFPESRSTPVTTTPIPSVGQASGTYQVGFDGLSYNTDGRQTLDLDLQKARRSMATVAVYKDRVEIYQRAPDGVLVTFRGDNFAVQADRITGPVTTAEYVTDPVEAPLSPGMVSGSVRAGFLSLTQPGMLRTTIGDRPDPLLVDQFRTFMEQNSLEYGMVAYTYDIRKSTMPPSGNAIIILTLPEQWVNQHGGISAVRIIRVSDTTGIAELIPAVYNGTDTKGIMQFRGISVNGTSVFGLVTLKATSMAQDTNPDLTIFPAQQPAVSTILGLFTWLFGFVQQNPGGAIAIVATAGAAYAGRRRGMW